MCVCVCVHLPYHTPCPDHVHVVVKQRGECWFTFRRKVATVRLHRASWRQVSEHVCVNESQQVAWIDVPALLVRAGSQQLDLKLYCLRSRTVQHKAVGSFQNLMQRVHNGELAHNLHYAGCAALKAPSQAVHEADVQHLHQQDAAHHVYGDVHSDEAGTHQDLAACEADTVTDTEGTVCVVHGSEHNEAFVAVHDEAAVPGTGTTVGNKAQHVQTRSVRVQAAEGSVRKSCKQQVVESCLTVTQAMRHHIIGPKSAAIARIEAECRGVRGSVPPQ